MRGLKKSWTVDVALTLAALTAAACCTVWVSSTRYLGVPYVAPTDPQLS